MRSQFEIPVGRFSTDRSVSGGDSVIYEFKRVCVRECTCEGNSFIVADAFLLKSRDMVTCAPAVERCGDGVSDPGTWSCS